MASTTEQLLPKCPTAFRIFEQPPRRGLNLNMEEEWSQGGLRPASFQTASPRVCVLLGPSSQPHLGEPYEDLE